MAKFFPDRVALCKLFVFAFCLLPFLLIAHAGVTNQLGPDPAKAVVDQSGLWAFRLLLASLAITPLRKLSGAAWWLRYRRMLGLFAGFYACVHVSAYVFLLFGAQWHFLADELLRRPYIVVGAVSFLLMLPLMVTSTRYAQKRMGRAWLSLHKSVYLLAVLALVHFTWVKKLGFSVLWPYVFAVLILLLLRLWWFFRRSARSAI